MRLVRYSQRNSAARFTPFQNRRLPLLMAAFLLSALRLLRVSPDDIALPQAALVSFTDTVERKPPCDLLWRSSIDSASPYHACFTRLRHVAAISAELVCLSVAAALVPVGSQRERVAAFADRPSPASQPPSVVGSSLSTATCGRVQHTTFGPSSRYGRLRRRPLETSRRSSSHSCLPGASRTRRWSPRPSKSLS